MSTSVAYDMHGSPIVVGDRVVLQEPKNSSYTTKRLPASYKILAGYTFTVTEVHPDGNITVTCPEIRELRIQLNHGVVEEPLCSMDLYLKAEYLSVAFNVLTNSASTAPAPKPTIDRITEKEKQKEDSAMSVLRIVESHVGRINKTNNTVQVGHMTEVGFGNYRGSATISVDHPDRSTRQGILEAIANAVCDGNFDKVYNAYLRTSESKWNELCTCDKCGTRFETPDEARECEHNHALNRLARHQRYLARKEAKKRLADEAFEKLVMEQAIKLKEEQNGQRS